MTDSSDKAEPTQPATCSAWLRLTALILAVVALGVPINSLLSYVCSYALQIPTNCSKIKGVATALTHEVGIIGACVCQCQ